MPKNKNRFETKPETGVDKPLTQEEVARLSSWQKRFFSTATGYRKYMTIKEFEAWTGEKKTYIERAINQKYIDKFVRKLNGVRFVEFRPAYAAMKQAKKGDPYAPKKEKDFDDDPDEIPDYNESNRKKLYYEAKIKQIESEEKSGNLIDREAVEKRAFELGRTVREKILSIPSRLAAQIVGQDDAGKIENMIERELEDALRELKQLKK
jgi:hypothetical protein